MLRWTIFFLVIDCDIHPQVGDVEEFLGYVDPAQREWFRAPGPVARDYPATPGRTRRPGSGQDIEQNGHPPASDVDVVRRELLDPSGDRRSGS